MFDDRVEFMSLGGIMPGVTFDLMLAGISVTRNEKLAQVLLRLNIIEAYGTGIPRIFGAYEKSLVKPEIPVVSGGFLIRVPNQNYSKQQIKANTNNREQRILEIFSDSEFTKEDAAETLGVSVSGAYKLLTRMSEKRLLQARKEGRQWMYSIVK